MQTLPSGCAPLDALLQGGLEPDATTLVFGEAGSGKTNFALECAKQAVLRGRRVAYVDTEGVSSVRLEQVFGEADASRLLFFSPFTIREQERMVQKATLPQGLGLVVVDSINMHYRLHLDQEDGEKEAARSLYAQLHHLTTFARRQQVPVLVTGQVYGIDDTTQPFARRVMEHLVKALIRFDKRPDGQRRATLLKHRSIPEGQQALFRIGPDGLHPHAPPTAGGATEPPPDGQHQEDRPAGEVPGPDAEDAPDWGGDDGGGAEPGGHAGPPRLQDPPAVFGGPGPASRDPSGLSGADPVS